MSPSAAPIILISAVLLLSSIATTTSAFNITILLGRYPGFEQFNNLLSQTHLAEEINRRKTITVLALKNEHIGEINGKTEDVQKRILSNHIILDYFDNTKLNKLKDNKTVLTTLYQASGVAGDQQGFLVVVHRKDGSIVFGSAVNNAPLVATLEGAVASQPYNISVLSVSQPIIAPGIDGTWNPMPAPPPKAPAPAEKVPPPPAESPVEEEPADAPTPKAAAPSPAADAPAPGPVADDPAADDDVNRSAPPKSAAGKQVVSGVSLGLIVALASLIAAH